MSADYSLSVLFLSYENPFRVCGADPVGCPFRRCCDNSTFTQSCEETGCDNYFSFCVREFGRTAEAGVRVPDSNLCFPGSVVTTMIYPEDNDDFDFAVGDNALGNALSNPYVYINQGFGSVSI